MIRSYLRCLEQWDDIYSAETADSAPQTPDSGNEAFDAGIRWLAENSPNVLDFGCGNGSMLFFCALMGTKNHIGIDLSSSAIASAGRRSGKMQTGAFDFRQGGIEQLSELETGSQDAVILSNILDNLYPEDAEILLSECARLLKPGGKAIIKLNPYLTEQQIEDWEIKVIEGSLLDDGLLLWNNTTEQWETLLERFFVIKRFEEIYYPEHEQTNRMFFVQKP